MDTVIIHDQPSGTIVDAFADVGGQIDLAAPSVGSWGDAYVSSGDSTVVTVHDTTLNPDGSVHVSLSTQGLGVAVITVPCVGDPSEDWTVTIDVDEVYQGCNGSGVCS